MLSQFLRRCLCFSWSREGTGSRFLLLPWLPWKASAGQDLTSQELREGAAPAALFQPALGHQLALRVTGIAARHWQCGSSVIKPREATEVPYTLFLVIFAFQTPSGFSLAATVRATKQKNPENTVKIPLLPRLSQCPLAQPTLRGTSSGSKSSARPQPGRQFGHARFCLIIIYDTRFSKKVT